MLNLVLRTAFEPPNASKVSPTRGNVKEPRFSISLSFRWTTHSLKMMFFFSNKDEAAQGDIDSVIMLRANKSFIISYL